MNRVANYYNGGTIEGVDFTGFSTLTLDVTNAQTAPYFYISVDEQLIYSAQNTQRQQVSFDVSSITGIKSILVAMAGNATGSAKLYNLILA